MPEPIPFDVVMIGPFPSDPERIEGGVQASLYGLGVSLLGDREVAGLRVVATPMRRGSGITRTRVAGIDVVVLDTPARILASAVLRLPRILAEITALAHPLVHIHGTGIVQTAVLLACRLRRIPMVWTMHGITEKEMREARRAAGGLAAWGRFALYAGCERLQLRLSPEIVVDTAYVAREVAPRAATPPRPIPQGIFPKEMAAALNPDRRAPIVVALGVIHPRKGHALTLRAFAEVARSRPDARLWIVGALAEASHLDELRALVAELGLGSSVEIRVNQPRDRVLAALREARVFALHSQEESQGIALCEAMAAGLPIVATRVGGIPDVIGASGAGLLVEYGDTAAMAGHIGRLLDDDTLHARLAEAALARAEDFSWRTIATRVLEVYRAARARLGA